MSSDMAKPSLLDEDLTTTPLNKPPPKPTFAKDPMVYIFSIACLIALVVMAVVQNVFTKQKLPVRAQIAWVQGKAIIIEMGTSRVMEALLYSGHDNRTSADYKQVQERDIEWQVSPQGIVTVDMYGQISPVKVGKCFLTLRSLANPEAQDKRQIQVVLKRNDSETIPQRVVKFKGSPSPIHHNLQKIVTRFTKQQIASSEIAPQKVKQAALNPTGILQNKTTKGDITWSIVPFADGSSYKYVIRDNTSMVLPNRDKVQHFMGDRYLPDDGKSPVMLETDDKYGVWIVGATGNTNHIQMVSMTYSQKAAKMNIQTKACVDRHGITSSANRNGQKCRPNIQDNDGLWTSIYGAGELMKYSILKTRKAPQKLIEQARQSALRSLKAVLLISNVAGREGTVKAKIRYLNNSATDSTAVFYSKQYLLKGKQNSVDTYVGLPSDGVGFFGVDSNKTIKGDFLSGQFKYSMLPLHPDDWTTTGQPATTIRHLGGYMSRTFAIDPIDLPIPTGGLFFHRSNSVNHTVLSDAHVLYDYNDTEHPQLQLGNKALPDVLKKHLYINGVQYNESNLIYKGDTSTDEVVGHLFLYKIAYDVLDQNDDEEKQLRQLIRTTMRNFCQQLINNGYSMVDATGQATKWSKLFKQFLTSDYTIEDAPLKSIQLLLSFKLAHYVTGQRKWKEEYDMLANDEKFKYLDLVADLWPRWLWHFTHNDDSSAGLYKLNFSLNPTQTEIQRHCIYKVHFSDEEQAFLAYYVAFQLEQNPQNLEKYRKGINGYWHSISRSQNPLWYYIYQIAFPDNAMKDAFDQDLRQVSSWQLSRHMIDTTKYQAYIKGSRKDVILEGGISADPSNIIGRRTSIQDQKYVSVDQNFKVFPEFDPKNIYQIKVLPADERSNHKFNGATFNRIDENHGPNSVEGSTTFSTPYWFGVYHNLIQFD